MSDDFLERTGYVSPVQNENNQETDSFLERTGYVSPTKKQPEMPQAVAPEKKPPETSFLQKTLNTVGEAGKLLYDQPAYIKQTVANVVEGNV